MADEQDNASLYHTKNIDIRGIVTKLRYFRGEISDSQSANGNRLEEFDKVRWLSYFQDLEADITHGKNRVPVDTPKYAGKRYFDLGKPEQYAAVENMAVNDLIEYTIMLEVEILNSSSSRKTFGFDEFDHARWMAIINNVIRAHINDYMAKMLPMDLPETTPSKFTVADGKMGLEP